MMEMSWFKPASTPIKIQLTANYCRLIEDVLCFMHGQRINMYFMAIVFFSRMERVNTSKVFRSCGARLITGWKIIVCLVMALDVEYCVGTRFRSHIASLGIAIHGLIIAANIKPKLEINSLGKCTLHLLCTTSN